MMLDPELADAAVAKVMGTLVVIALTGLGVWSRFYRTRKTVSVDNGERKRFEDAISDARSAREEAHSVSNEMMKMQRRMGQLEAENEACLRTTTWQNERIDRLEKQNNEQAEQIGRLIRRNETPDLGVAYELRSPRSLPRHPA